MDLQLTGKKAVVSGGSRGIGRAVALRLAQEGCDVVIGARSEGPLKEAAEAIAKETGRKVVPITVDTTDADSIKRFLAQANDSLGGLDILVNSAARVGGSAPDTLEGVTDDLLFGDFTEKTMGYFRGAREAASYMKRTGWGRIVNVGGVTVRTPTAFSTPARNAAMVVMAKALATALAPHGINVNVVHPGATFTEATQTRLEQQAQQGNTTVAELRRQQDDRMLNKHMVSAEEIADVVAFLCSPRAISVTGEAISVAGGAGDAVTL